MGKYEDVCAPVDASDPAAVKGLLEGFTGREWRVDLSPKGCVWLASGDHCVDYHKRLREWLLYEGGPTLAHCPDLPALLRALEDAGLRGETNYLCGDCGRRQYMSGLCQSCGSNAMDEEPNPYPAPCARCAELEAEVARLREQVAAFEVARRGYGRRFL